MPTYEYECLKCRRSFDYFQKMVDAPLKKCVLNGCKGKVRRLVSAGGGIIFKGSGFYETDYKKKSGEKPEGEKKSSDEKKTDGEKKTGTDTGGKTEAVPAPKSGSGSASEKGASKGG